MHFIRITQTQYRIRYAPQAGTSTATYFERMAGIEEKFYE